MMVRSLLRNAPVLTLLSFFTLATAAIAKPTTVRVNRWLEVRQLAGSVTYLQGGQSRAAKAGDRLQAVGDGIRTGKGAKAVLFVDTGIGQVNVGEQTTVKIQELRVTPSNGRITRLAVTGGQIRLQVRPFTNPDSKIEIQTPSGIAGVRGTEFGISVQPSGKTGIATLEGKVASQAQGQEVLVDKGFQSLTLVGEPPMPPVPLTNDTTLTAQVIPVLVGLQRQVRLQGRVDPVNSVIVNDRPQDTDRAGYFSVTMPATNASRFRVIVTTPLGKQQSYVLELP